MKKAIVNILKNTETLPVMFVGSGLSRRYIGLKDWEGLLRKFALLADNHEYSYELFKQKAVELGYDEGLLPKVAEVIEYEFNKVWFTDDKFSDSRKENATLISSGVSPFKIEISNYLNEKSCSTVEKYKTEIDIFKKIGKKGVAGFITTNYDLFLDNIFDNFTSFVGQEELLFSPILGISEIYKIHGCISKPDSIVINEKDYLDFSKRNAYLAAKLLTIFLEHPIIFIGYSISDRNIENILKAIVECLNQEHLEQLKKRMIFVEWASDSDTGISTYSKSFEGNKIIEMTRVKLNDFSILYEALLENNAKYNVSMLRRLKEDIYELVLTNKPSSKIRTVGLEDDDKLDEVEIVVGVGVLSEFGERGYLGVTADEIYKDVILDNGNFDIDRIIMDSLPRLLPQNSSLLPMHKYIREFKGELPSKISESLKTEYDSLLNNTILRYREKHDDRNRTISEMRKIYNVERCMQHIPYLSSTNIVIEDFKQLLIAVFDAHPLIFDKDSSSGYSGLKSDFKRAIRLFDLLKYGN
jgi:hypothetical protein